MTNDQTGDAILCDLSAIPADERESHIALGTSLLATTVVWERDDAVRFEVGADRLADVTRFIENERRCCRHLTFTLMVPARGAALILTICGPGVRDELHAFVR